MNAPSPVEALREIAERSDGCISANDLSQYSSYRGRALPKKVKTAQTVLNIAELARAALPLAEQQEKAFATMLEAAETVLAGLNQRIDEAPKDRVPVFEGIAELSAAIRAAKEPNP